MGEEAYIQTLKNHLDRQLPVGCPSPPASGSFLVNSPASSHLNRPDSSILATMVPLLIGGVLLLAAAAKAGHLFGGVGGLSAWFAAALVQVELLCGLALLLGLFPRMTRWGTMLLFTCFAIYTLHDVGAGAKSCGCVGDLPMKPVYALLFDIVALLGLWFWRPKPKASRSTCLCASWLASASSLIVFPALLWSTSQVAFPRLLLDASVIDLGKIEQGKVREVIFAVHNPHDRPVAIDRWLTSCPCLRSNPGRQVIRPGEQQYLKLVFDSKEEPGFSGLLAVDVSALTNAGEVGLTAKVRVEVVSGDQP